MSSPHKYIIPLESRDSLAINEQNTKLNLLLVLSILMLFTLLFIWSYKIYVNVNSITIMDNIDELEIDTLDMNYLVEQNYYKSLTNDKKEEYRKLSNQDKMISIKKNLMKQILI